MFLQKLNDREKKGFLYLAQKLITIDNKVKVSELSLLKNISREMGIDMNDAVQLEQEDVWKIFTSRESRMIILIELIATGYIDNDFSPDENELIKEIARKFSISDTKLSLMEQWVRKERDMYSETKKISSKEELSGKDLRELENLKIKYEEHIQKMHEF